MPSRWFSIFLLLIAMTSIQFGASVAKLLFPLLGPLVTTMLRTSLAALFLLVVWRPWRSPMPRKELLAIGLYGMTLGAMNLLFYLSLARIPLGIAVALEFTGPLTLSVFYSRRILDVVWILLAIVGLSLLLPISPSTQALDRTGILLAFGAGVCWAAYILLGKRAGKNRRGGDVTALGMLAASLLVLPFGLQAPQLQTLSQPHTWLLGGVVALLSSAIPYSLEMKALTQLSTQSFGVLMSLEPALAAVMGQLFLAEHLTKHQWMAIFLIILASVGTAATATKKTYDIAA